MSAVELDASFARRGAVASRLPVAAGDDLTAAGLSSVDMAGDAVSVPVGRLPRGAGVEVGSRRQASSDSTAPVA